MGNIDSRAKFQHGHIFLQTDHSYAISGENMTGNIYIDLQQPYPAVSLDIIVKGDEKCRWTERKTRTVRDHEGKSRTETYYVYHHGHRQVIHQRFTIYVFPNQAAMPGQYTFPFNIAIPYGCPSSAFFSGAESAVASIKYSIKAVLQPNVSVRIREMEFKQPLIIREKAPVVEENLHSIVSMTINSWCWCCSKGTAALETRFEKNAYTGLETCRAVWNINNKECTIPVQRIRIGIKQFIVLTSYSGVYRRTLRKGERFFDGIAAGEATDGFTKYLDIPLYEMKNKVDHNQFNEFGGVQAEEFALAETLQPTTSGIHVNITYQLSIKLVYDTYCANEPTCTIPLFIQAPPLVNFTKVEAPQGWNPQIYDEANFALPVPENELRPGQDYGEGYNPEAQPLMQSPMDPPPNQDMGMVRNIQSSHAPVHDPVPTPVIAPSPYPPPGYEQPQNQHQPPVPSPAPAQPANGGQNSPNDWNI